MSFFEIVGFLTVLFGAAFLGSGLVIFAFQWIEYKRRVDLLWRESSHAEEEDDDE